MIALVPIDTSGKALELYWPNSSTYADWQGLILDCLNRLTWILIQSIVWHHRCVGKCLTTLCRQEMACSTGS